MGQELFQLSDRLFGKVLLNATVQVDKCFAIPRRPNHDDGADSNNVTFDLYESRHDFPHRAFAAFAAIWERLRGLRLAALAAERGSVWTHDGGDSC